MESLKLSDAMLWTGGYLGLLLLSTFLDVALWRKLWPDFAHILNCAALAAGALGYVLLLAQTGYRLDPLAGLRWQGILLALLCALGFYLLLDKGLDPLLDRAFPQSRQDFDEALAGLKAHPGTALVRVCLIAPVMEELLTRGVILGGLRAEYGWLAALGMSAAVFAFLHFNLVQTLSALVCGLALGLLYLHTGSLLCCILAHAVYNCISYLALLRG